MEREIVRLQKVELKNLKNVGYGCVKFMNKGNTGTDILGLYGQNGSGKTALVDAISIFKTLLMGKRLMRDLDNYIKCGEQTAGVSVEFMITDINGNLYKILYEFTLGRKEADEESHNEDNTEDDDRERNEVSLVSEKVSMARLIGDEWLKMTPVLYYVAGSDEILPKNRYGALTVNKQENIDELRVLKLLTAREGRSFLFSKELRKKIREAAWEDEYKFVFRILNEYAMYDLHVFSNEETGIINANIALPISLVLKEKDKISLLTGSLNLNGVSVIPQKYFEAIRIKMDAISLVLKEIIPGLTIYLKQLGSGLNKKGEKVINAEIMAKRGNVDIPLRYESDGVKKLVSVLYYLILVFNDQSMTLVVDEFDSGIFEYLLGEILKVVEEAGKGQFIFTSHNLRALEVLDNKNIMFTTTNENNRYIRFKNVKASNNFRDVYFRDIVLGGQNECIYEATNPYMITRAFRLAGDEDAR